MTFTLGVDLVTLYCILHTVEFIATVVDNTTALAHELIKYFKIILKPRLCKIKWTVT